MEEGVHQHQIHCFQKNRHVFSCVVRDHSLHFDVQLGFLFGVVVAVVAVVVAVVEVFAGSLPE